MTAFEIVNWIEVFLWPTLGLACVIGERLKTGKISKMTWVLAGTFGVRYQRLKKSRGKKE